MAPRNAGRPARNRLPDPSSVLVELTLTPRLGTAIPAAPVPGGRQYRILRTLEVDAYETPVSVADIMGLATPQAAPADNAFRGTARKAAKLSIAEAELERFDDLGRLIATLPDHEIMTEHPGISTDKTNKRVVEENRNVRVSAFLYAASRENDNDYHLIIGRDPAKPPVYLTVEISGLPPSASAAFGKLSGAREAYFDFFGDGLPGPSYDFYDPPIPVEIEGSLFFDASHASGSRPGPQTLRPKIPVVWEIHPVTEIAFEP